VAAGMHDEQGVAGHARNSARRSGAGTPALSVIRPDVTPAERLLAQGAQLRFRAPELALVLGERAAALAEAAGSEKLWVNAEGLSVFARMRMGQRADVVHRAVTVLRTAEADGHAELAAQMRVELAVCARSAGVPMTGLAALRPILGQRDLPAVCRAMALMQLVGCLAPVGRQTILEAALDEADRLVRSDPDLSDVDRILLRAMVASRTAAHQRRHGDLAASLDTAQRALDLLDGLESAAQDGMQLRARIVLEMACVLLDRGEIRRAVELAHTALAEPARAAAVGPLAWLRLALATRVHLASGEAEAAGQLVRDALHSVKRYDLTWIEARLWLELSHVEEAAGRETSALHAIREARRCEHIYGRAKRQAIGSLTGEFGRGEQSVVDLAQLLDSVDSRAQGSGRAANESRSANDRSAGKDGNTRPAEEPATPPATTSASPTEKRSEPVGSPREPDSESTQVTPKVTLPIVNLPTIALPGVLDPTINRGEQNERPRLRPADSESTGTSRPESAGPRNGGATDEKGRSSSDIPKLWLAGLEQSEPKPTESQSQDRQAETSPGEAERSNTESKPEATGSAEATPRRRRAEGGTAARSVLERLGVSVGTGGRRRRVTDDTTSDSPDVVSRRAGSDEHPSNENDGAHRSNNGDKRRADSVEENSNLRRLPTAEPWAASTGKHAASAQVGDSKFSGDSAGTRSVSDGSNVRAASELFGAAQDEDRPRRAKHARDGSNAQDAAEAPEKQPGAESAIENARDSAAKLEEVSAGESKGVAETSSAKADGADRGSTSSGRTEPPRLDSLLAVFSNWPDDDDELAGSLSSRARHRRQEGSGMAESGRTNGRRFKRDDRPWGHRGDL